MKILLDQSAPRKLARFMTGHHVRHAAQLGWEEVANGKLPRLAEDDGYNLLITADQSIPYQHSVTGRLIGILALSTNNWPLIKPYVPIIMETIELVNPAEVRNFVLRTLCRHKISRPRDLGID